jgi:hypothetical protein
MNIMSHTTKPPITQLRPLHSYRPATETTSTAVGDASESLNWTNSLQPRPNDETAIKAFVKLVSRLIILEEGESFCIQDSRRGGFILAYNSSSENDAVDAFRFVECRDRDIPSDFSIGEGKVSYINFK